MAISERKKLHDRISHFVAIFGISIVYCPSLKSLKV